MSLSVHVTISARVIICTCDIHEVLAFADETHDNRQATHQCLINYFPGINLLNHLASSHNNQHQYAVQVLFVSRLLNRTILECDTALPHEWIKVASSSKVKQLLGDQRIPKICQAHHAGR